MFGVRVRAYSKKEAWYSQANETNKISSGINPEAEKQK
jgi:hypothetical protein|tara:strand:- start:45 stop:158 length:114 start_codon:yes stop_codon:yes gene_type:complete